MYKDYFKFSKMFKKTSKKTDIFSPAAILGHQLKNPISVIKGYLEVLVSEEIGGLNKQQKEYVKDALENVEAMRKIVNDIMDVSRIEGGAYNLKPKAVNLAKVTQEIIDDCSLWIKASNLEIVLSKTKDVPLAYVDPIKVRYVVENLLSNAIRYKGSGFGKIEVDINKKDNKVLFICKDEGVGIPQKDFAKVFSKFYRSEQAINLYPTGIGLGLYISKAIVELSGGKIWLEKNKDKGMTFYFTLPIAS